MKSRISYGKLWLELFRQQIWLFVLFFIASFMALPVAFLMFLSSVKEMSYAGKMRDFLHFLAGSGRAPSPWLWIIMVLAVFLGMMAGWAGFFRLHDPRKTDLYHSLPVRRNSFFWLQSLVCLVDYAVPLLINILLVLAIAVLRGLMKGSVMIHFAAIFLTGLVYCLLFYGISSLAMQLTGKIMVGILGTFTLELALMMAFVIYDLFCSSFYKTYLGIYDPLKGIRTLFSPWEQMYASSFIAEGIAFSSLLPSLLEALVLLGLAWLLHERRPSESAGSSMSFALPAMLIRFFLTVEGALLSGLFFRTIMNSDVWFLFGLVFGLLFAYGMIQMIYHLNIRRILSSPLQLAAAAAVTLIITLIFRFDLTGFDRRLPAREEIREISMAMEDSYEYAYSDNYLDLKERLERGRSSCDQELYDLLTIAVRSGAGTGDSRDSNSRCSLYVRVESMSGSIYYRQYELNWKENKDKLAALHERGDYQRGAYMLAAADPARVRSVRVENACGTELVGTNYNELAAKAAAALRKDLSLTGRAILSGEKPIGIIQYTMGKEGEKISEAEESNHSQSLWLYPSYRNTLALLAQMGYSFPDIPEPDRISCITYTGSDDREHTVTDPEKIKKIASGIYPSSLCTAWMDDYDSSSYYLVEYKTSDEPANSFDSIECYKLRKK